MRQKTQLFLSNLVLASDIFYTEPKIFIFKKKNLTTLIGGIFSIFTILSVLSLSIYFIYQVLARTTKNVIYSQLSNSKDSKDFILDHSEIPIMVGMFNISGQPLDNPDSIYNVEARYSHFDKVPDPKNSGNYKIQANFTNVILEKCDIDKHIGETYRDYFKELPYQNKWYCFVPGKYDLSLYGKYGSLGGFSFLDFNFLKCKNTPSQEIKTTANTNNMISNASAETNISKKPSCMTQSTIDSVINQSVGVIAYVDYDLDHDDVFNPIKPILKTDVMTLSTYLFKRMMINKKSVKYKTDYGLIFNSIYQEDLFYQTDFSQTIYNENQNGSLLYSQITLLTSDKMDLYSRDYPKIQNCLANIGGIIKGIVTIVSISLSFITDKMFFLSIINQLFLTDNESIKLNQNKFDLLKNMKKTFISNNIELNSLESPEKSHYYFKDIIANEGSKITERKTKLHKMKLTFKEYICPRFVLKKNRMLEKLEEYKKIVSKYLSVENMISNFNDINKIKNLYLNEKELELFNQIDYLLESYEYKRSVNSTMKNLDGTNNTKVNMKPNTENF